MDPRNRSAGITDFVLQPDRDFSDVPRWDPSNSVNRVDPYSSGMLYGGPSDSPIIGINDPRPQAPGVAATELLNRMHYHEPQYNYADPNNPQPTDSALNYYKNSHEGQYGQSNYPGQYQMMNTMIQALLGRR